MARTMIQHAKEIAWRETRRYEEEAELYEEGGNFPYINLLDLLHAEAASTRKAVAHSKKLSQGRPRPEVAWRPVVRDIFEADRSVRWMDIWERLKKIQEPGTTIHRCVQNDRRDCHAGCPKGYHLHWLDAARDEHPVGYEAIRNYHNSLRHPRP